MSRRARYAIVLLTTLCVVLGWALWPRGPRLECYTSPPFLIAGRTSLRLRTLVPAGLTAIQVKSSDHNAFDVSWTDHMTIGMGPQVRWKWLPERLRELLSGPQSAGATFRVTPWFAPGSMPGQNALRVQRATSGGFPSEARITVWCKDVYCDISHKCSDPSLFDATYRQVCESFRVIR